MSDNKRNYDEELWDVMSALADSVGEAPGEEILDDVREAGEDPEAVAMRTKSVLLNAVKSYRQRALMEARERYKAEVAAIQKQSEVELPTSLEDRRNLLAQLVSQDPQIGQALTVQFREFKSADDLSDSEVESALRQLSALGFIRGVG